MNVFRVSVLGDLGLCTCLLEKASFRQTFITRKISGAERGVCRRGGVEVCGGVWRCVEVCGVGIITCLTSA